MEGASSVFRPIKTKLNNSNVNRRTLFAIRPKPDTEIDKVKLSEKKK